MTGCTCLQIKRGGPRRSGSGLDGSGTMDLGTALETIVGARVGVWWDEDETYYKVRSSLVLLKLGALTWHQLPFQKLILPFHSTTCEVVPGSMESREMKLMQCRGVCMPVV